MPGVTKKNGDVRSGGTDAEPTWHTLTTLKALDVLAQFTLANALDKERKLSTQPMAAFKGKVANWWRAAIIDMLIDAETFWRSEDGLGVYGMPKSWTLVAKFQKWTSSFFLRLEKPRIDAAIAAAKRIEGEDALEPTPDGLGTEATTAAEKKAR